MTGGAKMRKTLVPQMAGATGLEPAAPGVTGRRPLKKSLATSTEHDSRGFRERAPTHYKVSGRQRLMCAVSAEGA